MKKIILVLLIIVLIAAGILLLKKRRAAVASVPTAVPVGYTIKTVSPQQQKVSQVSSFLAQLEVTNQASISSKLSGRIRQLLVTENQVVKSGELLVRIDDHEVQANISALMAKLDAAQQQRNYQHSVLQRNQALLDVGGISQEKFDSSLLADIAAAASVKELQQNIRGLRNQLSYFNLRAPFHGIIGTILQRQGNLATPGHPVLTLNSLERKLTFSFTPVSAPVTAGQAVLFGGEKIGKIAKIYVDAKNGLSVAEVTLEKQLHQPNGGYLTIDVVTAAASGCSVPQQALLHRKSGVSVMAYQSGRFVEIPVSIQIQGATAAIISPCVKEPVAVAAEAKLSLLPSYGDLKISVEQ